MVGSRCLYILSCTAKAISSERSTDSLNLRGAADEGRLDNDAAASGADEEDDDTDEVDKGMDEGRAAAEVRAGGTIAGVALNDAFAVDRFGSSAPECE